MDALAETGIVDDSSSAIENFREFANQLQSNCPGDQLFSLVEPMSAIATNSRALAESTLESLLNIRDNEAYDSSLWGERSIIIARDRCWQLRLSLYTRASDYIYSLPSHFLGVVIGAAPMRADFYRLPSNFDPDVFVPGTRAELIDRRTLQPGEVFVVDARKETFDVCPAQTVLILEFHLSAFMQLQWAFDRPSKEARQAIASQPSDSELVTICLTLKAMRRPESATLLEQLTRHPAHFVRWAAIQALGTVHPDLALTCLRRALTDEHPHIRAAATKYFATSSQV